MLLYLELIWQFLIPSWTQIDVIPNFPLQKSDQPGFVRDFMIDRIVLQRIVFRRRMYLHQAKQDNKEL